MSRGRPIPSSRTRLPRGNRSAAQRAAERWAAWHEIIVGDDGSSDRTREIAESIARHDPLVGAFAVALSNGRLEDVNSKVRRSHGSFGFHSAAALIALVSLWCTGVVIDLPR